MSWAQIVGQIQNESAIHKLTKPKATRDGMKICTACNVEQPLDNFYVKFKHKHTSRCKPCYIQYQKALNVKSQARKRALREAQEKIPTPTRPS